MEGQKNQSTLTAKSLVDFFCNKGLDNDNITVVLLTNLSAAFDTLDHGVLIDKMEH